MYLQKLNIKISLTNSTQRCSIVLQSLRLISNSNFKTIHGLEILVYRYEYHHRATQFGHECRGTGPTDGPVLREPIGRG